VLRVGGAQLEVHEGGRDRREAVHLQREGAGLAERLRGAGEGRQVFGVGDAVVVVIAVKGIGDTVGIGVIRHTILIGVPLLPVADAVAVAVDVIGVQVPRLAAELNALGLHAVGDPVLVRVGEGRVGADAQLLVVGEPIAIGVGAAVDERGLRDGGVDGVGARGNDLCARGSRQRIGVGIECRCGERGPQ
jgi:hypothetical protein